MADLTQVFGNQSNPLSSHLRSMLLREARSSYKVGQYSKLWTLNKDGRDELARLTSDPKEVANNGGGLCTPESYAVKKYASELQSFDFKYNDSSNRLFHGLQNIKREHKQGFWSHFGLPFDYDIAACAPSILFQLAEQYALSDSPVKAKMTRGTLNLLFGTLQEYLNGRAAFRQHVADLTGCSLSTAKRLINSLFNGARLSRTVQCSAYQALEYDYDAMTRLQDDSKVQSLRGDIARMWTKIEQARTKKLGTSKSKWSVYFEHERKVLDTITEFLAARDTKFFTEHDGFRTSREVNLDELQAAIKEQTGFDLKVERNKEIV
ncbi:MAG: hypothetical protein V4532_03145 [Pseudomonadota bacterium]